MTSLIERLEKASEGSRELDAAIWEAATGEVWSFPFGEPDRAGPWVPAHPVFPDIAAWVVVPSITTSVDDALALVERALPGWLWDVTTITTSFGGQRRPSATVMRPDHPEGDEIDTCGGAATPALALCAAILKAKASADA